MFTGLVEEVGRVLSMRRHQGGLQLAVACSVVAQSTRVGDSIAVNGTCLTVTRVEGSTLAFDAVAETVDRTNLVGLGAGDRVNLERSLTVGGRVGGHFVAGHVDGTARLLEVSRRGEASVARLELPADLARFVAPKGSITIDGISLTVVDVLAHAFTVWVIPHTWANTNLALRRVGDPVNLEVDILARYVERLVRGRGEGVTYERLVAAGFDLG